VCGQVQEQLVRLGIMAAAVGCLRYGLPHTMQMVWHIYNMTCPMESSLPQHTWASALTPLPNRCCTSYFFSTCLSISSDMAADADAAVAAGVLLLRNPVGQTCVGGTRWGAGVSMASGGPAGSV